MNQRSKISATGGSAVAGSEGGKNQKSKMLGITLVELLVVIVIAAVLTSISVPAFISMTRGSGVRYAVRTTYNYLSLARQRAIMSRTEVAFYYNTNSFWLILEEGGTAISQYTNAPGVTFHVDGAYEVLKFRPDGALTDHTTREIEIKYGDLSRIIEINGITGGINVK